MIALPGFTRELLISCTLLIGMLWINGVTGQEPAETPAATTSALRGPQVRRIYILESQAPRLVPSSFWPVTIGELEQALEREQVTANVGEADPQLVSAVYVARFEAGALIDDSEASSFDLLYRNEEPGYLPLGTMNLAIQTPTLNAQRTQSAKLLTSANGSVHAVVTQDSRLRFGWSRSGTLAPDGTYEFDLLIPACGRTRMLLGLPVDAVLRPLDGVVTRLPSPPQEALGTKRETELTWYSIEAGGLTQVRLGIRPTDNSTDAQRQLALRKLGIDCTASPSGLDWTARLVVDVPQGQKLPNIDTFAGGRITSIRIDNLPIRWKEIVDGDRTSIQIVNRPTSNTSIAILRNYSTVIEISGTRALDSANSISFDSESNFEGSLPWVSLADVQTVQAISQCEILLRLAAPLRLAEFSSASLWSISDVTDNSALDARTYQLAGPTLIPPPNVRLLVAKQLTDTRATLRTIVQVDGLRATWDGFIQMGNYDPGAIEFEIQSGWEVESILIQGPNRSIDIPEDSANENRISIWPEPTDIVDGRLHVQIQGRAPLSAKEDDVLVVPAGWFVRIPKTILQCIAAVVPPPEYEWESITALRGRRLLQSELPASSATFLEPVSADTLLFKADGGQVPELRLGRPPAAFSSDVHFDLRVDGDEIVETIRVQFRVPAGRLPIARVELGNAGNRPPVSWSLGSDVSTETRSTNSLEARQISDDPDNNEVWELEPNGGIRDALVVVAQRRYPFSAIPTSWRVNLPIIPSPLAGQTTPHKGTLSLGPSWKLVHTAANVLRVPRQSSEFANASGSIPLGDPLAIPTPALEEKFDWIMRYDPTESAWIELELQPMAKSPVVIWEEQVQILSGASGDELATEYRIDGGQGIEIRFDRSLIPIEIEGIELPNSRPQQGLLRLAADNPQGRVRIRWWKPRTDSAWMRTFKVPLIAVNGIVLRRDWRIWSTGDSFIADLCQFSDPPSWMSNDASHIATTIAPGQKVLLVPTTIGWGIGASLSLLVFASTWWWAQRADWVVVASGMALASMVVVLPVWSHAITAFLVVPLVSASLLVSASKRSIPDNGPSSVRSRIRTRATAMLLIAVFSLFATSSHRTAKAQDEKESDKANSPGVSTQAPAPVLIPVRADGELAGNKVYVPKTLYDSLFRPVIGPQAIKLVDFQSAEYQVRIAPSTIINTADTVLIEATWRIEVESTVRQVRIPISPSLVDRLEVIVDSVPMEIRPTPDNDGVLIRLPKVGANTLRATLSPQVELTRTGANRIQFSIPPVAQSSLAVVSESAFDQMSVPGCLGNIVRSDTGNRLSGQLGPISNFELIWQRGGAKLLQSENRLQRRWWIHAGMNHACREMEMDIADGIRAGVVVTLEGIGGTVPVITSPQWTRLSSDTSEPVRDRFRMVATTDSPGPIRLMWSTTTSDLGSSAMVLEDVRPVAHVGTIETLVAFDIPDTWSLIAPQLGAAVAPPVEPASLTSAESDARPEPSITAIERSDFTNLWTGYRGALHSAIRIQGMNTPTLRFRITDEPVATAIESHRIVLSNQLLRVIYRATVELGKADSSCLGLLVPSSLKLERLQVNGKNIPASIRPATDGNTEVLLPFGIVANSLDVVLEGVEPIADHQIFDPPRVRLRGATVSQCQYEMVRSDDIRVTELEPPQSGTVRTSLPEYDLTSGTVPLRAWDLEVATVVNDTRLNGRYELTDASIRMDAASLTTLRWDDGVWSLEVLVDVDDFGGLADFLTFEIPSRWIDSLNVSPAAKWSSQPSTDPNMHLIRVLPQSTSAERLLALSTGPLKTGSALRIKITSRLATAGEGGISVPDLRLMGEGTRTKYFAAPLRLTSNPITWRTQYAKIAELPQQFLEVAPSTTTHTIYEVTGDAFSAVLQPAEIGDESARASILDISLFPQDDFHVVALSRLMLLPGDRQSIEFELPPGCEILGVWSNGIPTSPQTSIDTNRLSVPVGLSRLAQQMNLLVVLPIDPSRPELPLPVPIDLTVGATWIASYDDQSDTKLSRPTDVWGTAGSWYPVSANRYREGISAAIVDILDSSVDNVTERPATEKLLWLGPWFSRLRQLGWSPDEPNPLDSWTTKFVQRVFGAETPVLTSLLQEPSGTWLIAPSTWSATYMAESIGLTKTYPNAIVPKPTSRATRTDQVLRFSWFATLVFVVSAIVLFLTGTRWARHPSVWLCLLGILALFFVPLPIAVSTIVLALAGPWMSR